VRQREEIQKVLQGGGGGWVFWKGLKNKKTEGVKKSERNGGREERPTRHSFVGTGGKALAQKGRGGRGGTTRKVGGTGEKGPI